jgi:uncharacterized protein involved in outer membrane biogenesis
MPRALQHPMLRWAAWIAAGLVLIAVLTAGVAWWLIESLDLKQVVARVERAVEESTGRPLTIGSEPQVSLAPRPRLVVRDLVLANMDGATRPEMLKVRQLEIGLDLAPLLDGNPPGLSLLLVEPDLLLEVSARGRANWEFKRPPEDAGKGLQQAAEALRGRVTLDSVRIERATVRYEDRRERRVIELAARRAVLDIRPDDRYALALEGALNGKPVAVEAQVRGTAPGFRTEALRLAIGKNTLSGAVGIDRLKPRPRIRAELEAKVLDLPGLFAEPKPETGIPKETAGNGRIFSAMPLPLGGLHALDIEARLQVEQLILPGSHRLDNLHATLSLANGRLKIDPFSLALDSGRVSGRLRVDAASATSAAIESELQMKNVELGSLITLAGLDGAGTRGGSTDMTIQLAASGASVRALMATLHGHARVVVGEGRLPGKAANWGGSLFGQVLEALNPYRASEDSSPLKCAVLNVPVRRGVVVVKDTVAAETDKIVGSVTGSVDLGQERLDLTLHSQTVGGLSPGLATFASAAKLTGTLGKPELAVNVQGAAAAGLRIGAAVASAGVTLLAGSVARKAMPAHPCQAALDAKADVQREESQPDQAESPGKKSGIFGRRRDR